MDKQLTPAQQRKLDSILTPKVSGVGPYYTTEQIWHAENFMFELRYRTEGLATLQSVNRWAREGKKWGIFPNAYLHPDAPRRSFWCIPVGDYDPLTFERPQKAHTALTYVKSVAQKKGVQDTPRFVLANANTGHKRLTEYDLKTFSLVSANPHITIPELKRRIGYTAGQCRHSLIKLAGLS